jgi:tetratricopeptide (TPR) repeat protein
MSRETYHWWLVYGPFREGKNGLPHVGDVIRHFRELRGYRREEFAGMLGCTVRYVFMLESATNVDNPKLPSRREAIARALLVPSALFGLAAPSVSSDSGVIEILSKSNLDVLQSLVSLAWGMFYSGDFQQATQSIDAWLASAHAAQKSSKGVVRDQLNATIIHMLQLSATAARDRGDTARAYKAGQQALSGSIELSNVNLILASHHHLFRVYTQEEGWKKAQASIDASVQLVNHSSVDPAMQGTIYADAGEIYSILARIEPGLTSKALNFFDQAAQVARKHKDDTESEFIRFSLALVMNERASAAAGFHRMHDAENAIQLAKKTLPASNIRWNKDHLLSSADMHIYGDEDAIGCYTDMLEAIKLHKETNSRSNLNHMLRLHNRCITVDPGNKYRETVEEQLQTL